MALEHEYRGRKFRVVHCVGAKESFDEAAKRLTAAKAKSFARGIVQQIMRLADGHKMTKENFPAEEKLPKQAGNKRFHALKRKPIRGYCWLSTKYPNTYFISHYVFKDYQKLADRETDRVRENWIRIEEKGHDR